MYSTPRKVGMYSVQMLACTPIERRASPRPSRWEWFVGIYAFQREVSADGFGLFGGVFRLIVVEIEVGVRRHDGIVSALGRFDAPPFLRATT